MHVDARPPGCVSVWPRSSFGAIVIVSTGVVTVQHAQRVRQPPRRALQSIPQLEVCEIAEPEICCDSTGIYNLVQPQAAAELRDRKTRHLLQTGADLVVSSNPGCLLQISIGLEDAGHVIPTVHLIELLDASIRGVQPFTTGLERSL